ncbi:hypothetical protein CFC21_041903 [Triticum aestivum]|uniref:Uncharacterized protein n=3 Tax=Triticum TaxID=4564 RepID=A0A9R1QKL6_TRITD|nr:hypothetical protein CFC21_041903 [Triticum aestivum]VAH78926.1 unnamed protein product [Triticum turgidum subsp. durum]
MEEEKAAAYYDELNRKGEGARRFKQGLGFSSDDPQPASFSSKPSSTSSSSFLSGFVRAGASPTPTRPSLPPEAPSRQRRRSRSPSPSRPRPRSRSPSRSRRRRSRSRSRSRERRRRSRSRERGDRRASHHRSRSRSRSPSRRSGRISHAEGQRDRHGDRRRDDGGQSRHSSKGRGGTDGGKVDYSRLIEGYDRMTPAERVKAKMKLQLAETASKDSTLGTATVSWGRFEFNKDAPLDEDDNDVEGKSFRLSTVESKNESIVRDAHDEAMFGVPMSSNVDTETSEDELKTNGEGKKAEDVEAQPSSSLISDEVMAMQKMSWRERMEKLRQNSNT